MNHGYLRIGLCNIVYHVIKRGNISWRSDNGFTGECKFIKEIIPQYHEALKIHKARVKNTIEGVWNPIYGYKCNCGCDCNKEIHIK